LKQAYRRGFTEKERQAANLRKDFFEKYIVDFDTQ